MRIPIITTHKEPDSVLPYVLDQMLACGQVFAFERSSGWAMVGRDPLRAAKNSYHGYERRSPVPFRLQSMAA